MTWNRKRTVLALAVLLTLIAAIARYGRGSRPLGEPGAGLAPAAPALAAATPDRPVLKNAAAGNGVRTKAAPRRRETPVQPRAVRGAGLREKGEAFFGGRVPAVASDADRAAP